MEAEGDRQTCDVHNSPRRTKEMSLHFLFIYLLFMAYLMGTDTVYNDKLKQLSGASSTVFIVTGYMAHTPKSFMEQ